METNQQSRLETEALIEAIWGPASYKSRPPDDPLARERQNKALAAAMRAYLQQYLAEI